MIKAKDLLPGDVYKLNDSEIQHMHWLVVSTTPTLHDQVLLMEINCLGTLKPAVVSRNRSLKLISRSS